MNLYTIDFIHYSPKDSEEGMYGYIISENDESVYEWIKTQPKITEDKTLYNSYSDYEDDKKEYEIYDEDYNPIGKENFKERMVRLHGEMYDEDAPTEDLYYGLTYIGWSLVKENISDNEIEVLKNLKIINS